MAICITPAAMVIKPTWNVQLQPPGASAGVSAGAAGAEFSGAAGVSVASKRFVRPWNDEVGKP